MRWVWLNWEKIKGFQGYWFIGRMEIGRENVGRQRLGLQDHCCRR